EALLLGDGGAQDDGHACGQARHGESRPRQDRLRCGPRRLRSGHRARRGDVPRPASPSCGHSLRRRQRPSRLGPPSISRRSRGSGPGGGGGWGRPVKGRARVKLWVVFGDDVKFGEGRAELLETIERLGSFKQAVERMGMSYRAAWGYFRELERAAGLKLLERRPGRGPEGGTRLTAEGRLFL